MDIQRVHLRNVGRFGNLNVKFAPQNGSTGNVTVFIGGNGTGKTSILKATATALSWLVSRIRSEAGSGAPIPEEVIRNGEGTAAIDISIPLRVAYDNGIKKDVEYLWTLAKTRPGRAAREKTNLTNATSLASHYRDMIANNSGASLPLIAFYPVERVVINVPLKIRTKHTFEQIDGYDNSLNQGVDFRKFFEWFRNREDAENESALPQEVLDLIRSSLPGNEGLWTQLEKLNASSRDRQLSAVRAAISEFMPGFENLKVRRKPRLHMSIDKNGETLNILQLSQGEKTLLALVGDIARRLAMMNPDLQNPLKGDGIVLIDEIDLHLHPTWQKSIIDRLIGTFPNCQFILTTHSPLVISECKEVLIYSIEGDGLVEIESQFGKDANSVLRDVMHTSPRNEEIQSAINEVIDLIHLNELDRARRSLKALADMIPGGSNIEVAKANLLLRKQELRNEKIRSDT